VSPRSRAGAVILLLTLVALGLEAKGQAVEVAFEPAHQLTGGQFEYTVKRGDSLRILGTRYGVPVSVLARDNHLPLDTKLEPGMTIRIDNRHIPPAEMERGILINVPQRMLFFFETGKASGYPVAVGKPSWQTRLGSFKVVRLARNPTWIVPESIQLEMEENGEEVLTEVPPGPDNPLGRHAIYLSIPGYLVHGTNAPLSIYSARTHGCIRLNPADIEALYPRVKVGDTGEIVYRPAMLAVLSDGRIFVEVNRDIYHRAADPVLIIRRQAEVANASARMDWKAVAAAASKAEGIAREVELAGPPANAP